MSTEYNNCLTLQQWYLDAWFIVSFDFTSRCSVDMILDVGIWELGLLSEIPRPTPGFEGSACQSLYSCHELQLWGIRSNNARSNLGYGIDKNSLATQGNCNSHIRSLEAG